MLHAGIPPSLADGLVQQVVRSGRSERGDISHPETSDGFGDELKFGNRNQVERTHVEQRALGFRIERPDRFQGVAEEIEPDGLVETGGKQIEDAAAHGVFAGLANRRGAIVAVVLQPCDDRVHRHHVARRDRQGLRRDDLARGHALHNGVDGREQDQRRLAAGQTGQPRQRREPLGKDAAVRRDPIVGLAVPCRELHHRNIGREEFQRARQLLHARTIAADNGEAHGRSLPSCLGLDGASEIGGDKPLRAFRDVGKRQRAAGRERVRG